MKTRFIFIFLISELFCIQYLPKEGIINLPTDSNNGSIYLNATEFQIPRIFIYFLEYIMASLIQVFLIQRPTQYQSQMMN